MLDPPIESEWSRLSATEFRVHLRTGLEFAIGLAGDRASLRQEVRDRIFAALAARVLPEAARRSPFPEHRYPASARSGPILVQADTTTRRSSVSVATAGSCGEVSVGLDLAATLSTSTPVSYPSVALDYGSKQVASQAAEALADKVIPKLLATSRREGLS